MSADQPSIVPRGRVQKVFTQPSRTKESDRDRTDINKIIAQHRRTGVVTHLERRPPMYGDFSQALNLQTALDQVHAAREEFMRLPAEVRKASMNDPAVMLHMLATEEGRALLEAAGLELGVTDPPPPDPTPGSGAPAPTPPADPAPDPE